MFPNIIYDSPFKHPTEVSPTPGFKVTVIADSIDEVLFILKPVVLKPISVVCEVSVTPQNILDEGLAGSGLRVIRARDVTLLMLFLLALVVALIAKISTRPYTAELK